MILRHSKNFRAKYNAFLGVEGKKRHKNNVPLGQRRLRIPLGRKHQYTEMHITLLRPHILRMDLEKQRGQPRGRQEIPAGDEAEQRGRLTRLEICGVFSQEMAVKDNRLSGSGAQGGGSNGGSRAALGQRCRLRQSLLLTRSKALFFASVLLARVRSSVFYISIQEVN